MLILEILQLAKDNPVVRATAPWRRSAGVKWLYAMAFVLSSLAPLATAVILWKPILRVDEGALFFGHLLFAIACYAVVPVFFMAVVPRWRDRERLTDFYLSSMESKEVAVGLLWWPAMAVLALMAGTFLASAIMLVSARWDFGSGQSVWLIYTIMVLVAPATQGALFLSCARTWLSSRWPWLCLLTAPFFAFVPAFALFVGVACTVAAIESFRTWEDRGPLIAATAIPLVLFTGWSLHHMLGLLVKSVGVHLYGPLQPERWTRASWGEARRGLNALPEASRPPARHWALRERPVVVAFLLSTAVHVLVIWLVRGVDPQMNRGNAMTSAAICSIFAGTLSGTIYQLIWWWRHAGASLPLRNGRLITSLLQLVLPHFVPGIFCTFLVVLVPTPFGAEPSLNLLQMWQWYAEELIGASFFLALGIFVQSSMMAMLAPRGGRVARVLAFAVVPAMCWLAIALGNERGWLEAVAIFVLGWTGAAFTVFSMGALERLHREVTGKVRVGDWSDAKPLMEDEEPIADGYLR